MRFRLERVLVLAWVAVLAIGLSMIWQAPPATAQTATPAGFNRCQAVTTSDTVDLPLWSNNSMLTGVVYVGGAGNLVGVFADGTAILFTAPPVGAQLPIAIRRVNATNTTATAIVVCYRF